MHKSCKNDQKYVYIQQKVYSFQEIYSQKPLTTWMFPHTYSRIHTTILKIKHELCKLSYELSYELYSNTQQSLRKFIKKTMTRCVIHTEISKQTWSIQA